VYPKSRARIRGPTGPCEHRGSLCSNSNAEFIQEAHRLIRLRAELKGVASVTLPIAVAVVAFVSLGFAGACPPADFGYTPGRRKRARAPEIAGTTRVSNGLKELLWNLDGLGKGKLLDLAGVANHVEFLHRARFPRFLGGCSSRMESIPYRGRSPVARGRVRNREFGHDAGRPREAFLNESLQYPKSTFDAVLLWDLLDYLEPTLAKQMVASVTELLRPAGVVFAMFHSKSRKDFSATASRIRTRCK